ncbi:MAG: ThuA domain-containing protein [Gemmataceae bacterium]|nr:ThuA domain-containing protein [Gemmataceae bacterium]
MKLLSAILVALVASHSCAAEPWADPKMAVRDGLELWLDASRSNGPTAPKDVKVEKWWDASGKGRHVTQSNAEFRPSRHAVGPIAVVRFDGQDDCLRAVKQDRKLESFSVFLVAVPKKNPGAFLGMMAFNAAGQRDYTSGLNIDFGPFPTPRFTALNVEGPGFGGAGNLRTKQSAFGEPIVLELTSNVSEKSVRLALNGQAEGQRARQVLPISMDEITVGARFYNNGPGPQLAAGFCRCDIAELLVFDRTLSGDELKSIRGYLTAKYAGLKDAFPPDLDERGSPLVSVKDPPPVQTFLPGFTVHELPVQLTNINNIKYKPDGTLVALGYDGNIWHLKDTDGDGLEDKATLFYKNEKILVSPIGMDLTPPNYKHGDGIFVAAQGQVLLIVDTNGDGKADKEIVVAGGWKERSVNIDVIGVAVDPKDHSIWFGRGTPNYANGYLLDKDGNAKYSLSDERGTIQRVAPDFKSREVIATGIRFPVGMRFNAAGDLFCSDQEGATWLPNGNPLDELLHVQKGRHYGFPPRHPKHLPNVIDEPSTFDYGPQHQSTCGINFNDPVRKDGPTFGPKDWAGDLFVTGESRGKLYRTKLVKTPAGYGYIAKTDLFACLNMLTVDVCLTPDGSLLVACHSGGPDWGSGPTGKGKLYKISYTDRDLPQPVLAWPSGPNEIRIEFDRPVDPQLLKDVASQTKVTAGKFVRAGDRFESLWPGYAVVQAEKMAPRFDVPVRSAQLTPDQRSLILATDPHTAAVHYAVTLPGLGRKPGPDKQHPQVDLAFDLSGCEATWTVGEKVIWSGWLPSLDLEVSRKLTIGSAPHDSLWKMMEQNGELTLKANLNLQDMLRPAVQPGSSLDYQSAPEKVLFEYLSHLRTRMLTKGAGARKGSYTGERVKDTIEFVPQKGRTIPVTVELMRVDHPDDLQFTIRYFTSDDPRPRPFPLHRALLPWADTSAKALEPVAPKPPPELAGGSWARGRKVFFSEQGACSKCHTVHGKGETIGPDLSNLIHRDYASVMRDIEKPSFAINPDHLTYTVNLKDGRSLVGAVQAVGDTLRIGDKDGKIVTVPLSEVESRKASAVSTMPEELPKLLGPERMKDLLTYLLTSPVSMPRDYLGTRPKSRTVAEVNAMLAGAPNPPEKTRPIRIVLVAGPKDHGPGEHDYPAFQKAWKELLGAADNTEVETAWEWPSKEQFAKADAMVVFQHGSWNAGRAADVDAFLERGGGMVFIHWAVDGGQQAPEFAKRIGLAGRGSVGFRHGAMTMSMNKSVKHPVLRNFDKLDLIDETYWKMVGELKPDRILATAIEEKAPQPQLWSLEHGKGRVFVSIPGHYSHTFDDPLFRVLLLRGIAWSAKEPVDRFNELVWPGADVAK